MTICDENGPMNDRPSKTSAFAVVRQSAICPDDWSVDWPNGSVGNFSHSEARMWAANMNLAYAAGRGDVPPTGNDARYLLALADNLKYDGYETEPGMLREIAGRLQVPPAVPREWIEDYAALLSTSLDLAARSGAQELGDDVAAVRARQRQVDAWLKAYPVETTAAPEPCRIHEHDGAFKCYTHKRLWGAVSNPSEPCAGWQPESEDEQP